VWPSPGKLLVPGQVHKPFRSDVSSNFMSLDFHPIWLHGPCKRSELFQYARKAESSSRVCEICTFIRWSKWVERYREPCTPQDISREPPRSCRPNQHDPEKPQLTMSKVCVLSANLEISTTSLHVDFQVACSIDMRTPKTEPHSLQSSLSTRELNGETKASPASA